MVGRYGGDEMALLLPKAARAEGLAVGEKIRQTIQENCSEVGVTISIGVAQYPLDGITRDDLVSAADENLYVAKARGGNRVVRREDVAFRLAGRPDVRQAAVVGDFNNWSVRANPMSRVPDGAWETVLSLPPGKHRYKIFINDRDWTADPSAKESSPDGFGGRSSIVAVG
jgi:predicted signal transduction protein with EAL and GGDEF domain